MTTKTRTTPNVELTADRIMVRRIEPVEQTYGRLVIPETARDKTNQCDVVAIGPGRLRTDGSRVPMSVAVGDRVLIGRYGGTEIKLDDVDYLILREDDVIAVVR